MRTQPAWHLECRLAESLSRGLSYTVLLTYRNCEKKTMYCSMSKAIWIQCNKSILMYIRNVERKNWKVKYECVFPRPINSKYHVTGQISWEAESEKNIDAGRLLKSVRGTWGRREGIKMVRAEREVVFNVISTETSGDLVVVLRLRWHFRDILSWGQESHPYRDHSLHTGYMGKGQFLAKVISWELTSGSMYSGWTFSPKGYRKEHNHICDVPFNI